MEIITTKKERLEKLNRRLEAYKRILNFLHNEISKDKPERRMLLQTAFQNVLKLHQTRTQEKAELTSEGTVVSYMIPEAFYDSVAEEIPEKDVSFTDDSTSEKSEVALEETSPPNCPAKESSIEAIESTIFHQSRIVNKSTVTEIPVDDPTEILKQKEVALDETSPPDGCSKKSSIETIKSTIFNQSSIGNINIGNENTVPEILDIEPTEILKQEEVALDKILPSKRCIKTIHIGEIKPAILEQSSLADTNITDVQLTEVPKQESGISEETPPFSPEIFEAIHNQSNVTDMNTSDDINTKILDIKSTEIPKHEWVALDETSPPNVCAKKSSIETIKPTEILKQEEVVLEKTSPSKHFIKKIHIEEIKPAIFEQYSLADANITDVQLTDVPKQESVISEETPPFSEQVSEAIASTIHNQSDVTDISTSNDIITKILDIKPTEIPKHEWLNLRLGAYNKILNFIHNELGKNKPAKQKFLLTARNHISALKQKRSQEKTELNNSSEASNADIKEENVVPIDENVTEEYEVTSGEFLLPNETSNQLSVGGVNITNENIISTVRHIKRSEVSEQEWMNLKVKAYKRILEFMNKEIVKNRPGQRTHLQNAFKRIFVIYKKRIEELLNLTKTSNTVTKVEVDEENKAKNILTADENSTESTQIVLDESLLYNESSKEIIKVVGNNQEFVANRDIKKMEPNSRAYKYIKKKTKFSTRKYKWMDSKVEGYKRILEFIHSEIGKNRPGREVFLHNAFTHVFAIYNRRIKNQIQLKDAAETVDAVSPKSITEEISTEVKTENILTVDKLTSDETSLHSHTFDESRDEIVKPTIHHQTEVVGTNMSSENTMSMIDDNVIEKVDSNLPTILEEKLSDAIPSQFIIKKLEKTSGESISLIDANIAVEVYSNKEPTIVEPMQPASAATNLRSKNNDINEESMLITDENFADKVNTINVPTIPEHVLNLSDTISNLYNTNNLKESSEETISIIGKVSNSEQLTIMKLVHCSPATINLQCKNEDIDEKDLLTINEHVIDKSANSNLSITPKDSLKLSYTIPNEFSIYLEETNKENNNVNESNMSMTDENITGRPQNSKPLTTQEDVLEIHSQTDGTTNFKISNEENDTINYENNLKVWDKESVSIIDENIKDIYTYQTNSIPKQKMILPDEALPTPKPEIGSQTSTGNLIIANEKITENIKKTGKNKHQRSLKFKSKSSVIISLPPLKSISMTNLELPSKNDREPEHLRISKFTQKSSNIISLPPLKPIIRSRSTAKLNAITDEILQHVRDAKKNTFSLTAKSKWKSLEASKLTTPTRIGIVNLEIPETENNEYDLSDDPTFEAIIPKLGSPFDPNQKSVSTEEYLKNSDKVAKEASKQPIILEFEQLKQSPISTVDVLKSNENVVSATDKNVFTVCSHTGLLSLATSEQKSMNNFEIKRNENEQVFSNGNSETFQKPCFLKSAKSGSRPSSGVKQNASTVINQKLVNDSKVEKEDEQVLSHTNTETIQKLCFLKSSKNEDRPSSGVQNVSTSIDQNLVNNSEVLKIEDEQIPHRGNNETVKLWFLKSSKNDDRPSSGVDQNVSTSVGQNLVNNSEVSKTEDEQIPNHGNNKTVKKLWFLKSTKKNDTPPAAIDQNVSTSVDQNLVNNPEVTKIEDEQVSNNENNKRVKKLWFFKKPKQGSRPVSEIDENVSSTINPIKKLPFTKFGKKAKVFSETDTSEDDDRPYQDFVAKTLRIIKEGEDAKNRILNAPPKKESTFDDSRVIALISKPSSVPNLQFNSEDFEDTSDEGILIKDKDIAKKVCSNEQPTNAEPVQAEQDLTSNTNPENNKDENTSSTINGTEELSSTNQEQSCDCKCGRNNIEQSEESSDESLDFERLSITDKNIVGNVCNNKRITLIKPEQPKDFTFAKDDQQKCNDIDENISSTTSHNSTPEEADDNQKPEDETLLQALELPIKSQPNMEDFKETNNECIATTSKTFSEEMLERIQELKQKLEDYKAEKAKDDQVLGIRKTGITNNNSKKSVKTVNKKLSSTQPKQNAKTSCKVKVHKQSLEEVKKELEEQEIRCKKVKDALRRLKSMGNNIFKSGENVSPNDHTLTSGKTPNKRDTKTQGKDSNKIDKHTMQKPSNNGTCKGVNVRNNKMLPKLPGPCKKLMLPKLNSEAEARKACAKGDFFIIIRKYQEAVEEYSRAIDFVPNSAVYFYKRAVAFNYLDNHEICIADLNIAKELNPKYYKVYGFLGMKYSQVGMFIEAKGAFTQALTFEPDIKLFITTRQLIEQHLYEEELVKSRHTESSYLNLKYEQFKEDPRVPQIAFCLLHEPSLHNIASAALENKRIEQSNITSVLKNIQEETEIDTTTYKYKIPLSHLMETYPTKEHEKGHTSPKSQTQETADTTGQI